MDLERFQNYLGQMQGMVSKKKETPDIQEEIVALIQAENRNDQNLPHSNAFFQGELLFHTGQYEQSLKHYLAAKGIPLFQFFCYRASSAIAHNRGQKDRAMMFAEKAAKLNGEDPTIQDILNAPEGALSDLADNRADDLPEIAIRHIATPHQSNRAEHRASRLDENMHLGHAIEGFQQQELSLINLYLERLKNRKKFPESFLCALNGWNFPLNNSMGDIMDAANRDLKEALALAPTNVNSLMNFGMLQWKLGQKMRRAKPLPKFSS